MYSYIHHISNVKTCYLRKHILVALLALNCKFLFQNEKENLHKELDHYQHELATLHTTYSQRIAMLNKKHKQEMQEMRSSQSEDMLRVQDLEQQLYELSMCHLSLTI